MNLRCCSPQVRRCPVCLTCPVEPGHTTCGDSWCQEAQYHRNMARTTRSKRLRAEHQKRADLCAMLAEAKHAR